MGSPVDGQYGGASIGQTAAEYKKDLADQKLRNEMFKEAAREAAMLQDQKKIAEKTTQ